MWGRRFRLPIFVHGFPRMLLLAAALPVLLVNQPPPAGCTEAPAPRVNFRNNVARATSSPWIDSNAWRFIRNPQAKFCIEASGKLSALAAAEAFAYGITAFIHTDADGVAPFNRMLEFLRDLPVSDLPPLANIGVVDDGAAQTGELMNLLSRRNMLYRAVSAPDPHLDVNISAAGDPDPNKRAYAVRQQLGDSKRLLRLYGSEVVIGRLTGDRAHLRLHLVNYAQRPVNGLRVRVAGDYPRAVVHVFGIPDARPADLSAQTDGTEFTIVAMNEYAVIDLSR
jgi:hypothetical protein